jgi:hypothetical protein
LTMDDGLNRLVLLAEVVEALEAPRCGWDGSCSPEVPRSTAAPGVQGKGVSRPWRRPRRS